MDQIFGIHLNFSFFQIASNNKHLFLKRTYCYYCHCKGSEAQCPCFVSCQSSGTKTCSSGKIKQVKELPGPSKRFQLAIYSGQLSFPLLLFSLSQNVKPSFFPIANFRKNDGNTQAMYVPLFPCVSFITQISSWFFLLVFYENFDKFSTSEYLIS